MAKVAKIVIISQIVLAFLLRLLVSIIRINLRDKMFRNYFTKNLKEGEETVRIVRQYPWCYAFSIVLTVLLITLPFFLMFLLFRQGWWGILIFFLLLILGLIYGSRQAMMWYFDGFLITNQRIIDFDQKGLFDRAVSEAQFSRVQDISFKKKGVFQTMLNYGTVVVQTASSKVNLELKNVYQPEKVQSLLVELTRKVTEKSPGEEMSAQELVRMLQSVKEQLGEERFDQLVTKQKGQKIKKDDAKK